MKSNTMCGKVCLITGASQGLGRHFSTVLAKSGATVIITSLKNEMKPLENLVAEISGLGGKAIAVPLDMRDYTQFTSIIDNVEKQTGHIDVLVNNASVSYYTKFFDIQEKDWDIHLEVNLKGVFLKQGSII